MCDARVVAANTTPGGYNCGEVTSAMQKCLRRGLDEDALFWATELDLAGYGVRRAKESVDVTWV